MIEVLFTRLIFSSYLSIMLACLLFVVMLLLSGLGGGKSGVNGFSVQIYFGCHALLGSNFIYFVFHDF